MSAPAALPLGRLPFRISKSADAVSTAAHHLATRTPVPFGDSPQIRQLLERPTWSVRSLMPKELREVKKEGLEKQLSQSTKRVRQRPVETSTTTSEEGVTPEKLRHLLRLSALPPPKNEEEESKMLRDLRNQIHFVKQIQKVNTEGVEPLVAIRDETPAHIAESTITLEDLKPWLDQEEKVGRGEFSRVRRPRDGKVEEMDWDPFQMGVGSEEGSGRRWGRHFVVKKAKKVNKVASSAAAAGVVKDTNEEDVAPP